MRFIKKFIINNNKKEKKSILKRVVYNIYIIYNYFSLFFFSFQGVVF